MRFKDILEKIPAKIIVQSTDFKKVPIEGIVVTDMMSNVLAADYDNFLLVTALSSDQVIRTADVVSASGVLIVNNKPISSRMEKLAHEFNITLLSTELSAKESNERLKELE